MISLGKEVARFLEEPSVTSYRTREVLETEVISWFRLVSLVRISKRCCTLAFLIAYGEKFGQKVSSRQSICVSNANKSYMLGKLCNVLRNVFRKATLVVS